MNEHQILVIYHADCTDGYCAAFVAQLFFQGKNLPEGHVKYVPFQYGQLVDMDDIQDKIVYILDFSFPQPTLNIICNEAKRVYLLDHHKTALENLKGFKHPKLHMVLDMERSGAGLTWDHFFSQETRPSLVNYVEDADLWKFKLHASRNIRHRIHAQPFTFEDFSYLLGQLEDIAGRHDAMIEGDAIALYKKTLCEGIIRMGKVDASMGGQKFPLVNAPRHLSSDIGDMLGKDHPLAATYFVDEDGMMQFSLRSRAENPEAVDVAEFAKQFGGGGHKHAAGFKMPVADFFTLNRDGG